MSNYYRKELSKNSLDRKKTNATLLCPSENCTFSSKDPNIILQHLEYRCEYFRSYKLKMTKSHYLHKNIMNNLASKHSNNSKTKFSRVLINKVNINKDLLQIIELESKSLSEYTILQPQSQINLMTKQNLNNINSKKLKTFNLVYTISLPIDQVDYGSSLIKSGIFTIFNNLERTLNTNKKNENILNNTIEENNTIDIESKKEEILKIKSDELLSDEDSFSGDDEKNKLSNALKLKSRNTISNYSSISVEKENTSIDNNINCLVTNKNSIKNINRSNTITMNTLNLSNKNSSFKLNNQTGNLNNMNSVKKKQSFKIKEPIMNYIAFKTIDFSIKLINVNDVTNFSNFVITDLTKENTNRSKKIIDKIQNTSSTNTYEVKDNKKEESFKKNSLSSKGVYQLNENKDKDRDIISKRSKKEINSLTQSTSTYYSICSNSSLSKDEKKSNVMSNQTNNEITTIFKPKELSFISLDFHSDTITEIGRIKVNNNYYLYSCSYDRYCVIWDMNSFSIYKKFFYSSWVLSCTSYNPFNSYRNYIFVCGGFKPGEIIKAYDFDSENESFEMRITPPSNKTPTIIRQYNLDEISSYLIVGTELGVLMYELPKKSLILNYETRLPITCIKVNNFKNYYIYFTELNGILRVIDLKCRKVIKENCVGYTTIDLECIDDCSFLVSGDCKDCGFKIIYDQKPNMIKNYPGFHSKVILGMNIIETQNGNQLVTLGADNKIKFFSIFK